MNLYTLLGGETWKDRWQKASFRGVTFQTESLSTEVGRRNIVHEYPYRDVPTTEDMGLKARKYTVNAYVLGHDHDLQRNSLLKALETAGEGDLIHPEYGLQKVVVDTCTISTNEQQRITKFAIIFTQAGKVLYPATRRNVVADMVNSYAKTVNSLLKRFAPLIQVGLTLVQLKAQVAALKKAYLQLSLDLPIAMANGLPASISPAALLTPATAAPQLHNSLLAPLTRLLPMPPTDWAQATRLPSPDVRSINNALTLMAALNSSLNSSDVLQQHLYPAILGLTLATATRLPYESVEQAQGLRQQLHSALQTGNALLETPLKINTAARASTADYSANEVVNGLRDLLVLVDAAAEQQLSTLPHVHYLQLNVEQPALVLAWQEHQDSAKVDTLLARNSHIIHPLFISASKPCEVLK